jgi:sugar lactone lactonase YvrE
MLDSERGTLYWVDIVNGLVHVFDPVKSKDTGGQNGSFCQFYCAEKIRWIDSGISKCGRP